MSNKRRGFEPPARPPASPDELHIYETRLRSLCTQFLRNLDVAELAALLRSLADEISED